MSAQLYSTRTSAETESSPHTSSTVGGSKPLHRFTRGQPKIVGIITLILGTSLFVISVALHGHMELLHTLTVMPVGFLLGSLFILCGIMYIIAEHNPTKKTVTISLALGVVTIPIAAWNMFHMIMNFSPFWNYEFSEDNATENDDSYLYPHSEALGFTVEAILMFYILVGIVIFIVMSSLAGAALRSTKSQAVVMMTAAPIEAPVE